MSSATTLLSPKVSDAGVITASTAVGSAGPANLQNERTSLIWQSTDSQPYLVHDLIAGVIPTGIAFGYFNAQAADTVRIRGASSVANLTAAPSYDSSAEFHGAVNYWGSGLLSAYAKPHKFLLFNAGLVSARYWRIDFDWLTNTDGYVRGARLMIGAVVTPVDSAAPGWEEIHGEAVVEAEDINGGQSSRPRGVRRKLTLRWADGGLTRAEAAAIKEMLLERGSAKDIACCVDTGEVTYPMSALVIGRVKQEVSSKHIPVQYRTTGFSVEELGITEMR